MFSPALIIQKKRDGIELSSDEIKQFISGISSGNVTDYQASAFMMATFFQGMSLNETVALTEAMVNSGEHYQFSDPKSAYVDKHSTGGVGDKVSIILAPLAAACGIRVPMMSGRGLGFSGGTLDKLESIPGYDPFLSHERFDSIVNSVGCSIIGQSKSIAPADRKLYSLRDVTATVECNPLITGSILSKKIAEGARCLLLDVKVGNGAFMRSKTQAAKLAKMIIQVAKKMKLPARAVLTDMNQPLGYATGNGIEVLESIEVLQNQKLNVRALKSLPETSSTDLKEVTIHLCAEMLVLGKKVKNLNEGRKLARTKLADGSAYKVFLEWVKAQGGDLSSLDRIEQINISSEKTTWKAPKEGYLNHIQTDNIGRILIELGAGRKRAEDPVDHSVGIVFHKKLGAKLKKGDPIATVFYKAGTSIRDEEDLFFKSIEISASKKPVPKLIIEVVN